MFMPRMIAENAAMNEIEHILCNNKLSVAVMSDDDHIYSSESSSSSSHIALMASRVSGAMVRQKGVVAWASTLPRNAPHQGNRYH